ncbi:hypothetical protein K2Z83_15645 [Oscillochloris sp. ZM17-4]|uniref:hypothetical protein n=1 Tax=Oscillochloris sp. ZM17-4 TaxID=2866714 RepID=UPI001C73941E|nr:hypothetical protein [Oscillochloris sp. ZM17-4]MBX0329111.1 hypothetical protein [Oscillochloris sp. ZM17-4]
MIAVMLRDGTSGEPLGSWTVQDWVADADALQALADDAGCVVTVVPLAKIQPLDPTELVRRAKSRLADQVITIVTYRPRGGQPPPEHEELPL